MRQELEAKDFGLYESLEIAGILYVFPNFQTARIKQKIGFSAEAELFRGSLETQLILCCNLGYASEAEIREIMDLLHDVGRILNTMINRLSI